MITLRKTHKSIAALLLLLVFGLQLEASFACEIADYSGPLEICCCDDEEMPDAVVDSDPLCCEYSQDLVVKGSDPAQDSEAVAVGSSFEFEFDPPPVFLALLAIWLEPTLVSDPGQSVNAVPVHSSGTQTYLATQRLRI